MRDKNAFLNTRYSNFNLITNILFFYYQLLFKIKKPLKLSGFYFISSS